MKSLDEIWEGDLFKRQQEATQLLGYLEAVSMRPSLRDDAGAFVLSVDAPYGVGKSYFLRRFAEHAAREHPVAFVDAWTDDLEDEPLVALAATLDDALKPLTVKSSVLREKVANFMSKAGAIAKIGAVGLLKKGASLAITEGAVEAISDIYKAPSEIQTDTMKDLSKDLINDAADTLATHGPDLMQIRVENFRRGKAAIAGMKSALRDIVKELGNEKTYPPPVIIVIDELDRCRPTYAIKLLEEVKHLFDVEGVVFVLGMHGEALSHSVTAAYGTQFDGAAYLRRFFSRRYRMASVALKPLVSKLLNARSISRDNLPSLDVAFQNGSQLTLELADAVALNMAAYGLTARDAFVIVDALETSLALTKPAQLFLPLLMPLLCNRLRGVDDLAKPPNDPPWKYIYHDDYSRSRREIEPHDLLVSLDKASRMSRAELTKAFNSQQVTPAIRLAGELSFNVQHAAAHPSNYRHLLETVDRFSSLAEEEEGALR